jgi:hypothetical protein
MHAITAAQLAAFHRHREQQHDRATWLWEKRRPVEDSPAEKYLCQTHNIMCPTPPTLGYLPPHGKFPAALICAFALADEPEPGVLAAPHNVGAVLMVALTASGKPLRGSRARVLLGTDRGNPIMLAPANDGGGLAITVEPEDALRLHQAAGLGAWASGHPARLPALARSVPPYVEAISIYTNPGSAAEASAQLFLQILKRDGERSDVEVLQRQLP